MVAGVCVRKSEPVLRIVAVRIQSHPLVGLQCLLHRGIPFFIFRCPHSKPFAAFLEHAHCKFPADGRLSPLPDVHAACDDN